MPKPVVIDTNIIIAGLITADADSPTARILDSMLKGDIPYLMSEELLLEYSSVLRRPNLVNRHQLTETEVDTLLAEIVVNAVWREPVSTEEAPDAGDDHLWRLLAAQTGSILVTGDRLLSENPPQAHSVISARGYAESFLR